MNYKEWSSWVEGMEQRKRQTGCVFRLSYCFWVLIFMAFKGFLYAFGAWVFLKMIGLTL